MSVPSYAPPRPPPSGGGSGTDAVPLYAPPRPPKSSSDLHYTPPCATQPAPAVHVEEPTVGVAHVSATAAASTLSTAGGGDDKRTEKQRNKRSDHRGRGCGPSRCTRWCCSVCMCKCDRCSQELGESCAYHRDNATHDRACCCFACNAGLVCACAECYSEMCREFKCTKGAFQGCACSYVSCSNLFCRVTMGDWSHYYARSLCGGLFVVWVALVALFLVLEVGMWATLGVLIVLLLLLLVVCFVLFYLLKWIMGCVFVCMKHCAKDGRKSTVDSPVAPTL